MVDTRRRLLSRRAAIAFAIVVRAASAAADAASPDTIRACGSDYYFTLTPPPGWELTEEYPAGQIALTFTPPGKDASGSAISFGLGRIGFRDDFDLDVVFDQGVAGLAARGASATIRDGGIRHPSLPTRSAMLEFSELSLYRVVMDVQSGRGFAMAATLTRVGGPPSKDEIQLFERAVTSLRYDAGRVCAPGPDDSTLEQVQPPPAAREQRSQDDRPEPTPGQRALRRAMSGTAMLQQLLVSVQVQPGMLAGSPTLLVIFDRGDERSAEEMLETFRERVAVTYCWAAEAHPLPRLAFVSREKRRRKDPGPEKLSPVRLYSCEKRDLGKSYPIEDFEFDSKVADAL